MITVTDIAGTSGTVTVEAYDLAAAITPWYPEAPAEVTDAIAGLQDAINRGEDTGALSEFLAITVEQA